MRGRIWAVLAVGVLFMAGVLVPAPQGTPGLRDERIASAQALLRQQRLYPGKVTGFFDRQTEAGIRRFQMLHSLRVTGRLDGPTLARMQLAPTPPDPAVVDADRRFLEELPPVAAGPAQEERAPEKAGEPPPIPPETVRNFLALYCKAASLGDPGAELTYYADEVDYFEQGPLSREELARELARNRRERPRQELLEVEAIVGRPPGRVEARFSIRSTPPGRRRGLVEKREATLCREPGGGIKLTRVSRPARGSGGG